MPDFTRPVHESNDCHDPKTGEFCSQHGVKQGDYLRVHTADGKKLRLKFKAETPGFIQGIEVDNEGDEIARPGKFDERLHLIQKSMITKALPLELDKTFATLKARSAQPQAAPPWQEAAKGRWVSGVFTITATRYTIDNSVSHIIRQHTSSENNVIIGSKPTLAGAKRVVANIRKEPGWVKGE